MEELCPRQRSQLWLRIGIRLGLYTGCVLVLLLAGPNLLRLFAPFLAALLLAWLLNPSVRFFQKKLGGSRRLWSLCLLLGLLFLPGYLLFSLLYNIFVEMRDLANNWPAIWSGILSLTDRIELWWQATFPYLPAEFTLWAASGVDQLLSQLQNAGSDLLAPLVSQAGSAAMKLPSFAVALVVFFLGSYFITADYPHLRHLVFSRISPDTVGLLRFIKHTASTAFGGYIRAQFLLSAVVFFILLAGFTLVSQPYAFLLALLLAVMDFIPIIGAGTLLLPWAALCLLTRASHRGVQLLVIWGIIALFRRVAEPRVVGGQTGLSPILSLISIYAGMRLGGIPGMILGPVVFLVVLNLLRAGVFDGVREDLRLASRDIRAILGKTPPSSPKN